MYGIYGNSDTYAAYLVRLYTIPSRPYCSKLTKSLVNVSLIIKQKLQYHILYAP